MASLDLLERLRPYREQVEVVERKPPRELVAAEDIIRIDELGRQVVACPAGKSPPHWLELTEQERDTLIEPPESLPEGYLHPGPYGFTPEGVVVGGYTIEHPEGW
jgi:hypothetical protein